MRRHTIIPGLMLMAMVMTITTACHAASLSEAFSQGSQFGHGANTTARGRIDSGTASTTVPGYTTSAPPASYFGGAGLSAPSATMLTYCAATPQDPACKAVNFSQTNAGVRPSFTIAPNNPLLTRAKAITADPASIAGNIAGAYSACTTQTVTAPDIFTNRICNEYRYLEQHTCNKTLSVTVTDNGLNCTYGAYLTANRHVLDIRPAVYVGATCADDIRFRWMYTYSECTGTINYFYVNNTLPGPEPQRQLVNLGCAGVFYVEGSCPEGNCNYTVGLPNWNMTCLQECGDDCCQWQYLDLPLAGFNFQRPVHTYTFTDAWDNQCATWEARLP